MRSLVQQSSLRSLLGGWTSLLVLFYAVAPGAHFHDCDAASHGLETAPAWVGTTDGAAGAPDDDASVHATACDLCRLLSASGALAPGVWAAATPAPTDAPVLRPDHEAPFGEPVRDDLGRAPPAHTR